MCSAKSHVRFTPESGHLQCTRRRPLSAKSGHCAEAAQSTKLDTAAVVPALALLAILSQERGSSVAPALSRRSLKEATL